MRCGHGTREVAEEEAEEEEEEVAAAEEEEEEEGMEGVATMLS
jgi:hypothetical protein